MPRRRRGAKAVAVDTDQERNIAMRILLHSPKDTVAGMLAFAAVSAIITNALKEGEVADVRRERRWIRQSIAASASG